MNIQHEEDENLNSNVYKGFQNFHYDRKKMKFLTTENNHDNNNDNSLGKRYFISLMSESLIRNGIFSRLRKRNKVYILYFL